MSFVQRFKSDNYNLSLKKSLGRLIFNWYHFRSATNQLAVSTSRGLMILNVIPNPRDQSNHINFRLSLILQGMGTSYNKLNFWNFNCFFNNTTLDSSPQSNPVLFRLAQKYGFEEYLSRFEKVENATFILDTALPASWKQFDGPKNLKQVAGRKFWSSMVSTQVEICCIGCHLIMMNQNLDFVTSLESIVQVHGK